MKVRQAIASRFAAVMLATLALIVGALAATQFLTPAGESVGSIVLMWINGSGNAVPASAANPLPMTGAAWAYTNIATAGNTPIKTSPGSFGGIVVNSAGNLSSAVVYDNTTCTGMTIATLSTTAQNAVPFGYGVATQTGLCIATADTTTPANITVLWR
jgi:hypothetical protein